MLGVFSHAAGEEKQDVGRLGSCGLSIAGPIEEPDNYFGIMAIHLTTERDDMRKL